MTTHKVIAAFGALIALATLLICVAFAPLADANNGAAARRAAAVREVLDISDPAVLFRQN